MKSALFNEEKIEDGKMYYLPKTKKTEVFYQYHTERFFPDTKIFLWESEEKCKGISNCDMFQYKVEIVRGIQPVDAEMISEDYKLYLNNLYCYHLILDQMTVNEKGEAFFGFQHICEWNYDSS